MRIYDRYKLDSSEERQRQVDGGAKARRGIRQDYNVIQTCAAISFAVFFGILVVLWLFEDAFSDAVFTGLCILLGIAFVASLVSLIFLGKKGDDTELDLYIYGMKNGRFLLLNQLYETLERIDPAEVKEIRILSAMRPLTRQRRIGGGRGRRNKEYTNYEYFGEKRANGRIRSYPMAVLCTGKKRINWKNIDDPIRHRQLNHLLSFVPMGDKEEHFVYLLQNSRCPVVVAPKVYRRYREHLDALFVRSGMDMNRVEPMKENPEQKIIG